MTSIRRDRSLRVSPEEALARHADPARWPEWMTDLVRAPRADGDGGPGTSVNLWVWVYGLPQPFRAEITECGLEDGAACWSATVSGLLMTGRESWTFTPRSGDTQAEWRFDYTPRGGSTGRLIDRVMLRKAVEKHMDLCMGNIEGLCRVEAEEKR